MRGLELMSPLSESGVWVGGHHSWRVVEKPDVTEPHGGRYNNSLISTCKHKEILVGDLWALSKNITTPRRESTFLFYNGNPILC